VATTKKLTDAQKAKQLATEKAELLREREELEAQLKDLQVVKEDHAEALGVATSDPPLEDPVVIRDPFHGQNPHEIIAHPRGFVLGWKSELYRDRRGWRGWEKISYDDEYGQNISRYIPDPPARMEHGTDMYVRRGDSVLCRLPEAYWLARQQQRTDKANRLAREHANEIQVENVRSEKEMASKTDSARSMLRNLPRA
jgi:hypothetical protein